MTYIAPAGDERYSERVRAMKAIGPILTLDKKAFMELLHKVDEPAVVVGESGFFSRRYNYLSTYKGFYVYARTKSPLSIPEHCEVIKANKIWVPG